MRMRTSRRLVEWTFFFFIFVVVVVVVVVRQLLVLLGSFEQWPCCYNDVNRSILSGLKFNLSNTGHTSE